MVEPYVCDVSASEQALKEGKEILLEGQLGTLKRPRSRYLSNGYFFFHSGCFFYGAIGAGVPPYEIQKILVVLQGNTYAVGAGAFVS